MIRNLMASRLKVPAAEQTLPGRPEEIPGVPERHAVLDAPLKAPFGDGVRTAVFGLGCFWGAERLFWQLPGVVSTAVGYAGGTTPNPTYEEVCSGQTGHTEAVLVAYDPAQVSYEDLLKVFWEGHDPTQGMRQGNDVGTQYRSAIFTFDENQRRIAETVKSRVNASGKWRRPVVTEIATASIWYPAEAYHQKYLLRNPGGYTCHFMRD